MKCNIISAFLLAAALSLAGCGTAKDHMADTIQLTIQDGYVTTVLDTTPNHTVAELLEEAEIMVRDQDQVSMNLSDVVNEAGTEIRILRQMKITVMDDHTENPITVLGGTVADALQEAGISLGVYDEIDHEKEMLLSDKMTIRVERRCQVMLMADGKTQKIVTGSKTVRELLEEQGISLGAEDRLSVDPSEKLAEGLEIELQRVSVRTEVVEEVIPFGTKTEKDSSITEAKSYTKQSGKNGIKQLTYEITYVDGKEESRALVKEEVTVKPQDEIKVKGTKIVKKKTSKKDPNIVSKKKVYDCDGSKHGVWIITYKDGTVKVIPF